MLGQCSRMRVSEVGALTRSQFRRALMSSPATPPTSITVDGPVCVITGGSRGIGRAIALKLGEAGCRVVVNYASSAAAASAVVEDIRALGGDGVAIQADMRTEDGIKVLYP